MRSEITTEKFWKDFWGGKLVKKKIPRNYYLSDILFSVGSKIKGSQFIELGGFPGFYSVFVRKYMGMHVSLLDKYIDEECMNELCAINNVDESEITIIKEDIFKFKPLKKYDLVFSFGLVEHFINLDKVIGKHMEILKRNGYSVIGVPNFLGLNGYFQKIFDPKNLSIHNLKAMDVNVLEKIIKKRSDVKDFEIFYYGGLAIWLENLNKRSVFLILIVYITNIIGRLVKIAKMNSKFVSPYVFLIIHKK